MKLLLLTRAGIVGAAAAGAAALAVTAGAGAGLAATAAPQPVVMVDCSGAHVKPATFNRLCGDGSDYITGMRWVSWKGVAFGSGTEHVNDCNPSCAAGHIYTYPVLLAAWRALNRPGHRGQMYFSRLTEIHTGALTRPHAAKLPLTFTWHLGSTTTGAAGLAAPAVAAAPAARPAAASVVIVSCADKAQVKPSGYVIACGDGNDYLTGLHWVSWRGVAFGSGTEHVNSCNPNCAAGKVYAYPVLVTLWGAKTRPGHGSQRYFSRLTEIHTGSLSRPHAARLPLTFTQVLAPNYP